MALKVITQPATEPVTNAEADLWMRYTGSLQDNVIDALITAARQSVESWINRTLVTTTYEYYLNDLCALMEIPTSTVQSITSITYIDTNGDTQTLSSTLYGLDNVSVKNSVYLKPEQTFPAVQVQPNAVKITFPAGYGAAADVPDCLKTVIKMRVSELFEHREANTTAPRHANDQYTALMSPEADYRF